MRYRTLGDSGIDVSEIGFGCGPTTDLVVCGTPREQQQPLEGFEALCAFDVADISRRQIRRWRLQKLLR
jgi:aryl-alcohol dehydrogenase-like predicted oxidoreductase